MRTIKITAGMTDEFEVIRTDADDVTIIEQLKKDNVENNSEPYDIIEGNGFKVETLGCQYDDEELENVAIDKEFDTYDYC